MNIMLVCSNTGCRLTFVGDMTLEHSAQMEDAIIAAMRSYKHLDVDLSGVSGIDACGIHMLGLLHSLGGKAMNIVATSPAVDEALRRFPVAQGATNRRRAMRGRSLGENAARNVG